MKLKRLSLLVTLALCIMVLGTFVSAGPGSTSGFLGLPPSAPTAEPYPDAHKVVPDQPVELPVPGNEPEAIIHPCGNFHPEPPFQGLSPLSFAVAPGICASGYGDIAVWQDGGQDYVASAKFGGSAGFHIWNVSDPYNPVHLVTEYIPNSTNTTTIFAFKQGSTRYLSMSTRGSGCGWIVYDVTNPADPNFVSRKVGTDWCIVHEHFVSTNANGDADYAWLAMSGESGSGDKMVVLDLADIVNPVQTGRYERPDRVSFIHDVTVMGNRVYSAHWSGGLMIHDKMTLANNTDPAPLNPIDSIRPSGFSIHQAWPTTDGNYVFIEDEFLNASNAEKVKMYDIRDINNPQYVLGMTGGGIAATQQAHNLKILNIEPGVDQLFVAWYKAGSRGFLVDTRGPTPIVIENIRHEYRQPIGSPGFGGAWGMDYLPCTLRGQPRICVYTADYERHGIIIDALDYHPELDPYAPDAPVVTSPNTYNSCQVTITGTAHDYYSGVSLVEISIDNGQWSPATGTDNWTFNYTAPADGTYNVRVRVTDNGVPSNASQITSVIITVSGCTTALTPTPPGATSTAVASNTPAPPTATGVVPSSTAIPPTGTPVPSSTTVPATSTSAPPTPSRTSTQTTPPSATPIPVGCTVTFTDVPTNHTFYSEIRCLACRGVMGGYADGTFRPQNDATRGQISKMVSNAANYSEPAGTQMFADVPPAYEFYAYINRLARRGHMGGYACGGAGEPCGVGNLPYFRPGAPATRGQMAKIVSNAAGYANTPTTQTYTDVPTNSTFYVWIERVTINGVASGYTCGGSDPCDPQNRPYFHPERNITRGQLAKIIANAFFPGCQTP